MLVSSNTNRNAALSLFGFVKASVSQHISGKMKGQKAMAFDAAQTVSLTNSRGAQTGLKIISDSMQFTLKKVHFTVSVLLNHNTEFASKIVARCLAGAAPRGAGASRAQFEARLSSRQAVQQFATALSNS